MPLSLEVSRLSDAPTFSGCNPRQISCVVGEAAAVVVDEEATGAGIRRSAGEDAGGEFFAGQFEGFGGVGGLDVDEGGLGVFPAGGQLFEGRVRLVGFGDSWRVVVGGHACCFHMRWVFGSARFEGATA